MIDRSCSCVSSTSVVTFRRTLRARLNDNCHLQSRNPTEKEARSFLSSLHSPFPCQTRSLNASCGVYSHRPLERMVQFYSKIIQSVRINRVTPFRPGQSCWKQALTQGGLEGVGTNPRFSVGTKKSLYSHYSRTRPSVFTALEKITRKIISWWARFFAADNEVLLHTRLSINE